MANSILTIDDITLEALRIVENNLTFFKTVKVNYDNKFADHGAQKGDTVRIRKPAKFKVSDGAELVTQDFVEEYTTITLNKRKHVGIKFSSKERTLDLNSFSEQVLKPAVPPLANIVDADGLELGKELYNFIKPADATTVTYTDFLRAKAVLDSEAAVGTRQVVYDEYSQVGFVDSMKSLYNPNSQIASQFKTGEAMRSAAFEYYMDQNVAIHTTGSAVAETSIKVNGAVASGSQMTISGMTGNLKKGDSFTITGVFKRNPASGVVTKKLMQFVVTEDVANAGTTVKFSPAINSDSTSARANVSNAIPNGASVSFFGKASTSYRVNIAYTDETFAFACADLEADLGGAKVSRVSDDQLGLSIRLVNQYAINSDYNSWRLDILYGWKCLRPEWGVKVFVEITED